MKGEILLDLGGGEIAILFFQAPTERASLHGSTWGVVDGECWVMYGFLCLSAWMSVCDQHSRSVSDLPSIHGEGFMLHAAGE